MHENGNGESSDDNKATGRKTRKRKTKNNLDFGTKTLKLHLIRGKKHANYGSCFNYM